MKDYLVGLLERPACHGSLTWTVSAGQGDEIEEGEARSAVCGVVYPIMEGIGVFLTPDLPRNDLWEGVESDLTRYLRENSEAERRLTEYDPIVPLL